MITQLRQEKLMCRNQAVFYQIMRMIFVRVMSKLNILIQILFHHKMQVYPEAMLFPSKFWFINSELCCFPGAIPSGLLAHAFSFCGFEKLLFHIRTRITSSFSNTSSDLHYVSFCWDIIGNLSLNRNDSRMI